MRRIVLLGVCLFQVVMLWSVANTSAPLADKCWLALAHVILGVFAWLARSSRFPAGLLLVLVYAVVLWDWEVAGSIESVLAFAGCWLANMTAAAPTFVMRGRRAIALPVTVAVVLPFALHAVNPDWGTELPEAIFVTTLSIMVATRVGVRFLVDFALRADAAQTAAEDQLRTVTALRTASSAAAEDARILHDTVINTLGAIANGGAAISDLDTVRARCARDAATAESLRSPSGDPAWTGGRLSTIFDSTDLTLRRAGLDDAALRRLDSELPDRVTDAIVGAVHELLRNVSKHAHVDHADVDIQLDGEEVVITVSDDGIGFDGQVVPGRGLARSVLARASEAGICVNLTSAAGLGTTVTLRRRLGGSTEINPSDSSTSQVEADLTGVVAALRNRAGWAWSIGVTAVGLVLAVTSTPTVGAAYAMLAVAVLASAVAWFSRDHAGRIPLPAVIFLAVGASIAFVLSAAAADFGRSDVVLWQAIAPTAPLVPLLASSPGRTRMLGVLGLFLTTVMGLTVIVWQSDATAASVIPVAGVTALGLVTGWHGFQQAVERTGAQAVEDHRVAHHFRLDAAVRIAAEEARGRWSAAGLHEAADLLRGIAYGRIDPSAESTRAACAEEEAYLRQLTQINPELIRMGRWFARALRDGRDRAGELVVRTGEVDAPDDETADQLGAVLLGAVSSMSPGARLSATIFPSPEGLRMTLVGTHADLEPALRAWSPSATATMSHQRIQGQDLLEIVVSGSPPHGAAHVGSPKMEFA